MSDARPNMSFERIMGFGQGQYAVNPDALRNHEPTPEEIAKMHRDARNAYAPTNGVVVSEDGKYFVRFHDAERAELGPFGTVDEAFAAFDVDTVARNAVAEVKDGRLHLGAWIVSIATWCGALAALWFFGFKAAIVLGLLVLGTLAFITEGAWSAAALTAMLVLAVAAFFTRWPPAGWGQ